METQKKRMKRSPLQNLNLNELQFLKSDSKRCSNLSSSISAAASVSVEAQNAILSSLASSSSSSISSRTHVCGKLKTSSSAKSSAVTFNVKPRSKANEVPKKSFSEKPKTNQQPCLDKRQCGKTNTNPTYRTAQRSKLRCGEVRILKKRCEELEEDMKKNSHGNGSGEKRSVESHLDCTERYTPEGEKTPPVEASLSPEIQCGSHSKTVVGLKSSATLVCYGAGHLLSGVTDKRKCRIRGSLRGGCEKVNLFDDEHNDRNVISNSDVPLLAEASVRWLLSPCDEGREDQESDTRIGMEQRKTSHGSLSSGNIIQTPNSDSYEYVGWSKPKNFLEFEIDSTEILNAVSMSPRSEMSIRDAPGFTFQCGDLNSSSDSIQLQENMDSVSTLALSQAKISWRDGLVCKVDEFDCCKQIMPYQLSQSERDEENDLGLNSCLRSHWGIESRQNEDNALKTALDVSPIFLEYEPCISVRGKKKLSEDRVNACAESICTNGSHLGASCDSD